MAKISKKQAKDKIDQFEWIDEFKEENLANKRAKVTFIGTKKDNMKKSNFEEIVLDFIKEQKEFNQEQKEFNTKIESRLDVLEQDMKEVKQDIKDIQNCSTIKKELKETKK